MQDATKFNRNLLVPWYLMASYAYYELDEPFLTDAAFDAMAKRMLQGWPAIRHRHKHLITEDDLKAGTLLNRDFPGIVKGAAMDLIQSTKKRKTDGRNPKARESPI
ncbi:hypothetical protein Q9295_10110 [Xinfangfangia sp. CPCC 101601]|uniref:Uncharacterized protein n=1 Tax=Pseudogemmobacter lacusdianii TaxID=3069608 RepID=A0ABU0VY94_9RHOB|nr:hypothetical protein [Xinfangfangia sp. CPCC 101601]MDQ2066731.1 hypothetical protein [Xinfangfangia sp. CPCC 101601]